MLGSPETLPREEVIEFVLSCQHTNGGFGSHPQYDPHLLYTLSAVQILFMEDALDRIDIDKVASCMFVHLIVFCLKDFALLQSLTLPWI